MAQRSPKITGDDGVRYVVDKVKCPNCNNEMEELPTNYPLYDVQCKACYFRAQVKTTSTGPNTKGEFEGQIRGAGWDILEKTLKAGYQFPPLIVNYKWTDKETKKKDQKILFYPFVPRCQIDQYIRRYKLSQTHKQAGYVMFNYRNLNALPSIQLYPKKK